MGQPYLHGADYRRLYAIEGGSVRNMVRRQRDLWAEVKNVPISGEDIGELTTDLIGLVSGGTHTFLATV